MALWELWRVLVGNMPRCRFYPFGSRLCHEVTSTWMGVNNNKSGCFMDKNVSVYCIVLDSETEIIRLTDKGKQRHVLCVPRSCKQVE